jgi:hypothetical protein
MRRSPKSVIQTSPGLTAGILVLHPVEHCRPFQRGLVTQRDIRILVGNLQKHFPDGPPVGLGQLGELSESY